MRAYLSIAAAAAMGVQVGAAIVATRFVIEETQPASLALLRYLIGFLCLLPPVLLSAPLRFARRDLLPMGLLGIVQFGIVMVLLNLALQLIPSARAALIFATLPLLAIVLAAALRYEPLTLPKVAGVLLTVVGVGFALGEKALQAGERGLLLAEPVSPLILSGLLLVALGLWLAHQRLSEEHM